MAVSAPEAAGDAESAGPSFGGVESADPALCDGASSFLQSGFWGGFKARFGWSVQSFLVRWEGCPGTETRPLLVMRRRLAPGLSFAYVPWGPETPGARPPETAALKELAAALRRFFPGDTAFIRFDPPWYVSDGAEVSRLERPFLERPFTRAAVDIQPPDTVILDLDREEGELRGEMKPKWSYNIRLAERRGVSVRETGAAGVEIFYSLFRETARRDGIAIHGMDYYAALFVHGREYTAARRGIPLRGPYLYIAFHEEEAIAAVITLFWGKEAYYLYGASSNRKRNLMASYALQWKAIQDARNARCLRYDFFGIPPREDPAHPMAGLYRFKTGFGGRIIHRGGSWDYGYRPLMRGLFNGAEGLRKALRNAGKRR
jgi:lipid II:glycine glycyltransferase (peptidoglycan interpeptide bridge formation enzyme)